METNQQIRYCLYARKSSEQDERQAMSIDSQIKEMSTMAEREGLQVVAMKHESFSAKQSAKRPVFNELLEAIRNDEFDGILTWAPDRLSRNAGDLGSLVDLMDSGKLQRIRTFGQSFSNTPNEKFLLMILCSQAKLENDNRGINVKRGIRAKCEMGWRPCMPPLGYFTRAATGKQRDVIIDEERTPYIVKMFEMYAAGKSGRHIKQFLIENNVRTRKDRMIHLSMVYKILKNPFYYGRFEYPSGSGNWYEGKHAPLISEDLFDKVQKQLVVPQKSKWGSKEFPYKQFLKCYSCGSSIVGEYKMKFFKNGTSRQYVYYHCSRQVDYSCNEKYISESSLVKCLLEIVDQLDINSTESEPGFTRAVNKYREMMLASNPSLEATHALKGYANYVITRGSAFEKTRLIRNIRTSLWLRNRELILR